MKTVFTLTGPGEGIRAWGGEKGRIDAAMLRRCVPDAADRICFVSGSPGFVAHVGKELRSLGVRRSRIRSDPSKDIELPGLFQVDVRELGLQRLVVRAKLGQ